MENQSEGSDGGRTKHDKGVDAKKESSHPGSTLDKSISRRGLFGLTAVGVATLLDGDSRRTAPSPDPSEQRKPDSHEVSVERHPYDPTPEEIRAVEAIFDNRERPPIDQSIFGRERVADNTRVSLGAAKRNGLTLYDYHTYSDELTKEAFKIDLEKYKVETYLQKAKEFLERYDIELSFGDEALEKNLPNTRAVKQSLVNIINDIGEIPVEIVKAMGLKKLKMITIERKTADGQPVAGYPDLDTGDTYYFDPTKPRGQLIPHEGYHLYDVNHADKETMYHDTGFRALNPPEQIYTEESKPQETDQFISNDRYTYFLLDHMDEFRAAQEGGDTETVERLQKEFDDKAAQVATASDYGLLNVLEDKAEIGSRFSDPFHMINMLDRKKPILRSKTLFLLARLYRDNPAFVQFYADITHRE